MRLPTSAWVPRRPASRDPNPPAARWKLFASKWVGTWDQAGNIVGAIANEAGIEGVHIGRVDIREDHSFVDLPRACESDIQGIAESASRGPRASHQPRR